MREEPERPFRNLESFRQDRWRRTGRVQFSEWPCLQCLAAKIVAGCHRLGGMSVVPCPDCEGTGEGSEEEGCQAYWKAIARWEGEVKAYHAHVKIKEEAIAKLTEEEIKILKDWWFDA